MWFLVGTKSMDKSHMVKNVNLCGKKAAREIYKTLQWNLEGDDKKFDKAIVI